MAYEERQTITEGAAVNYTVVYRQNQKFIAIKSGRGNKNPTVLTFWESQLQTIQTNHLFTRNSTEEYSTALGNSLHHFLGF